MTAGEIISLADSLCPNSIESTVKLDWLCDFDKKLLTRLLEGYGEQEAGEALDDFPSAYTANTKLSVDDPFIKDAYLYYVIAKTDLHNGEPERYNESAAMYQSAISAFINRYNRIHMPKGERRWSF